MQRALGQRWAVLDCAPAIEQLFAHVSKQMIQSVVGMTRTIPIHARQDAPERVLPVRANAHAENNRTPMAVSAKRYTPLCAPLKGRHTKTNVGPSVPELKSSVIENAPARKVRLLRRRRPGFHLLILLSLRPSAMPCGSLRWGYVSWVSKSEMRRGLLWRMQQELLHRWKNRRLR